MRISTSMRWLVVAVSAAMLLAVAAACSSETVEVPGETVVVEKEVVKTVEVPGETVVKEVVKEVMVPGETVVVEKVVTETVEVPGETVVVKEEVVKTVEVPGETVTVEVVKTVEVPGETVVVEKEVVKTVEVPGETVVVEKEVVKTVEVPGQTVVVTKEVAGPERIVVKEVRAGYVTDPSTGKAVSAPQYGGTLTFANKLEPASIDPYIRYIAAHAISLVYEQLGVANWALDRDVHDYRTIYLPESAVIGHLAESWDISPDGLTYTFNIRKGVNWHNKAPMNGRELTAKDIEYNWHRMLGLGSGSSEPAEDVKYTPGLFNVESITATDKWTVVFKLKQPYLGALSDILVVQGSFILPPEVIEQYGDVTDWRNVVGTGPFELTDWVEGSSITYVKNPDYWGNDEKYPENRLPYVDEIRALITKDKATILALLRSGKADFIGKAGASQLTSVDAAMSLQRTNPELNLWPYSIRSTHSLSFNTQKPPWNDIRVRHAMQMAIDFETINATYMQGWADTTPTGHTGRALKEYITPFEEWPEEIKQYYRYDLEGAEALLDEAGYPRGADGVRFKTTYDHYEFYDLDYYQIVMEYLRAIGIGVEVKVYDRPAWIARFSRGEHNYEGLMSDIHNADYSPLAPIHQTHSTFPGNRPNVNDPVYDAMDEAAAAATTIEEQQRLVNEADMYGIEKHWWVAGPRVPVFGVTQPWVIGYNGEAEFGSNNYIMLSRLWIDQELKEAMGH